MNGKCDTTNTIDAGSQQYPVGRLRGGNLLIYDLRKGEERIQRHPHPPFSPPTLKCIQWNIERGYKLDGIIQMLKGHCADIIFLQELDIGCERSDGRDCAYEIANALGMRCAFLAEFEEIHSRRRRSHLQGGGVHGNAILSRFDFEARILAHSHHPYDWEGKGHLLGEPRRGRRAILVAEIKIPEIASPILCYCLHLEVFCGIFGRIRQFADVLEDSTKHVKSHPYQFIFGDFNTMAHGIARFSPFYCRDTLRITSIGYSEARWWQKYILDVLVEQEKEKKNEHPYNSALLAYTPKDLSLRDAERLRNPHFLDPFNLFKDTTLQGSCGLFCGKLDWTLLRGWNVLGKGMDNHDYRLSDHKLLYVIVRPVGEAHGDPGPLAYHRQHVPVNHYRVYWSALIRSAVSWTLLAIATGWLVDRWLRPSNC